MSQDLAAIFADEPWLDLPPNSEQQADILSKLHSIKSGPLKLAQKVLAELGKGEVKIWSEDMEGRSVSWEHTVDTHAVGPTTRMRTPKEFLLWAMNDPQNPLKDRIEAAKALLPYSS